MRFIHILGILLLSVLSPGFAQIYLGQIKRGLIFWGIGLFNNALYLFFLPLYFNFHEHGFRFAYWIVSAYLLGFTFFVFVDALKVLRVQNPFSFIKKYLPHNHALRFLILFVSGALLSTGFTLMLPSKSVYSYEVPTDSMSPTLEAGDVVVTVEVAGREIQTLKGSVVTYNTLEKDSEGKDTYKLHLARIAAVEDDRVRIDTSTGDLLINQQRAMLMNRGTKTFDELKLSFQNLQVDFSERLWNGEELIIPEGYVFMLRDNYSNGVDSRSIGPVDISRIGEKVSFISFSSGDDGLYWSRINKLVK